MPLSPSDKTAIIGIIGGNVLVPGEVIGQEGLNNLLGQHPEIEGRQFKLWLASRAVFDRVSHNAAITRSEFKVRRVYLEVRRYVQSDAYPRALEMLGDQGLVILAGPPGVGKTILVNLLLYEHLEKGYRAVLIQRDIEEGQSLFQEDERQVFYFDDFMGATLLGDHASSITGNDDRALLEFIAMVRATPTARFILTTREHIYAQAMGKSERLCDSDLDGFRVFLAPVGLAFKPGSEADKIARPLMAREIERARADRTDPLVLVGMARLNDADELLFVQLQSPGECGSAGCSTVSFRYTGERWVKIMDMAGGTVRIAASHHRGMPDLIVEDGNRLMWDGVKYRDAGYGQVRLAKDDGVATVKR